MTIGVIWTPNQIFEKSESRGEISKGSSPLCFCAIHYWQGMVNGIFCAKDTASPMK